MTADVDELTNQHLHLARTYVAGMARRLPPWIDRSEMQQVARLAVWKAARSPSRMASANFQYYCLRSVRNALIDFLRSQQARRWRFASLEEIEESVAPDDALFDGAVRLEEDGRARSLLETLEDSDQWMILYLHFWEELSFDEIAARLEMHPSSVFRRYKAAIRTLREAIDQ